MIRSILIAFWLGSTSAWATEYRSITLANGRVVAAEIQGITATSMTLVTPQGVVEISPQDLRTMEPLSEEAYQALPPWKVLVLPFSNDESTRAKDDANMAQLYSLRVLKSIPAVAPLTIEDLPPSVPENTRAALALCGTDLQCATRNGEIVGVDVVVMGDLRQKGTEIDFRLGGVFVNTPSARERDEFSYSSSLIEHRRTLTNAQYKVLFLNAPEGDTISLEPLVTKQQEVPDPMDPKKVVASNMERLAWAPVPGITALKTGNTAGFASALGAVTLGTAASVYVAGHATYSAPQMVAVSTLSSYGLTVLVNHIFAK